MLHLRKIREERAAPSHDVAAEGVGPRQEITISSVDVLADLDQANRVDRSWCTHVGVTIERGGRLECIRCDAVLRTRKT